jgi:putative PIN family toxin of toxin-antitoxin system
MKADRLVIDTNVFIAALITPSGTARQVINTVLAQDIDVLMSEATFDELVSRLAKPKFDRYRDRESWNAFVSALVDLVVWHEDTDSADGACCDPDDDKFLSLATIGAADAIISGDSDLLDLGSYQGIPIVSPLQFLQKTSSTAGN